MPGANLNRLLQAMTMEIGIFSAEPFVLGILAHVLDNIGSNIVHLVNGVYLYETAFPDSLELSLFDEWEIANHVVMDGTSAVLVLELYHRNVLEFRVLAAESLDKQHEKPVTGFYVLDVEILGVVKGQSNKL